MKKALVIAVAPQTARRLYYQGHQVCTSPDGHTTQQIVHQETNPVGEEFFKQKCLFGLVLPEAESQQIRQFQKQGLIHMVLATFTGITCMNFLMAYTFFHNYYCLGAFLALSYFSVHYWVKVFMAVSPEHNVYMQVMAKYGLSIQDQD
jgi:hypothetical protein